MDPTSESFAGLRARLDALDFRPRRSLGQNFLVDRNLLDAIARETGASAAETVVEIGPGPAWLTRRLAGSARRVVAIELDPILARLAREDTASLPNVEIVEGDALGGGSKHGLHLAIGRELATGQSVVAGNLPYSVAAPLLANLLEHDPPPARAVVLVQSEVADRLLAPPGTREYGPLTVIVRAHARIERLRELPPDVFRPRPKVRSTLLRLRPREDRPDAALRRSLHELVEAAFGERRKQLAPRLDGRVRTDPAHVLASHGLESRVRGEVISVETFVAIARRDWLS
ncbi:MAG TPA: 16S rRNA (adenine(1518)-N(6)/adenine(1519)-N(6))-dimethyltransferase RsmA [Planctomycetota bacterium]|nr:16S rRNA (adenine(1518)-N(6)/adenine(1519)-N(6))-dimethyltransferase RsmA [Planctomycetota bacterium]